MAGVDSPGLGTIEEGREHYCMVDLKLGLKGETSPLPHLFSQPTHLINHLLTCQFSIVVVVVMVTCN